MEDLIRQIAGRSKSDSIMLRILRSAMDKTQEQLQFKDGTIEFLHEQTTFYKLAAILVEGCLKIVKDDKSDILESSSSKVLSELIEIREWLVGQIRDMKQLIMEKDREFREWLENETRLRKAVELRERESVHLYQKLEDEKMILNTVIRARRSCSSCPNFSPRYLSKDWGLVPLEDEKMMLNTARRARRSHSNPNLSSYPWDKEQGSVLLEDENAERRARRSHSSPNLSLDSLYKERGSVELEDEKMILNTKRRATRSCAYSANLSLNLLNKKRGFVLLEDEKMIFNTETRARRSCASSTCLNPGSLNKESALVHLKQTLDLVFGRMQLAEALPVEKKWRRGLEREVESILVKGFVRDLQTKFDIELKKRDGLVKDSWFDFIDEMKNLFQELKDFFSRNDVSNVQSSLTRSRRTNSVPNLDVDFTQNLLQNDGEEFCGSHHVWKIIKNHESIIRRQREHRRDTLQREGASSLIKRNEDINAMERLIQDAITRLENFAQRKHKVSDLKCVGGRNRAQEKRRIPKPHMRSDRTSTTIQSFEAEIKKLQEERDGLCFQISVIEGTYQLLFRGVMKDFSIGLCCGEKETTSGESEGSDTYQTLMHYMKSAISENMLVLIFKEMVKEWKMSRSDFYQSPKAPQEDFQCSPFLQEHTESLLKEDIYKIYFREMTESWRSEALRKFDFEARAPRSRVMFQEETVKESKMRQSDPLQGPKIVLEDSRCSPILQDYTESLLREEIYKIYFRETTEEWRLGALKQFDFEVHTPQCRVTLPEEIVKEWNDTQSYSLRGSKTPIEDFRCSPIQDCTGCLLREEIYKIYFKETTEAWRSEALKQFDFEVCTPQSRVPLQEEIVKEWKINLSDSVRGLEIPQKEFRCSPISQDCTECLLREEIYKIYFREIIQAWRSQESKQFDFIVHTPTFQEETIKKMSQSGSIHGSKTPQEDFRCSDCTECLLREDIYKIYVREMTKVWRSSSEEIKQFDFEVRTPQSRRAYSLQEGTPRSRGGDGESSMIYKVDSLLKSLELEEDLMLKASSLIKEHSVSNNLVILNCEELEERDAIEWLITDDESTFCSVSEKLERALQQLYTSKELLAELEESLQVSDGGGEYYENSQFNSILSMQEEENTTSELELEGVGQGDWTENVLAIIKKFRFLVDDVEVELHENLERKCLRLEALKRQVDALSQPMAQIRTRKLLFEKAFILRCRNLRLAETEVDLLGDQVEALLSLLERIYVVLSRDARVLATYFEVYDILKLIKIELNGGRSSKQGRG